MRIGYATVVKLLRAGATVVTTTRFPCDAALRYSREDDFSDWSHRLRVVGPLELSDIRLVEAFCTSLLAAFPRIHVLINNAAQTLTRPAGWFVRMAELESHATVALSSAARGLLGAPATFAPTLRIAPPPPEPPVEQPSPWVGDATTTGGTIATGGLVGCADGRDAVATSSSVDSTMGSAIMCASDTTTKPDAAGTLMEASSSSAAAALALADFPERQLDESRQPLDLTGVNSWSRRLGEVGTMEVVQTLAANAAAPFVLCNRLCAALAAAHADSDAAESEGGGGFCSHVINVTAVEGKFSVGKKSHAHPHTNMGKAALNMLTFTSATSFYQQHRILMNSVDTGCKSCCRGLELLPIPMPLAPLLTRATCTRAP